MSPLGLYMTTMGALGGPGMMGDPGGPAGPVKHIAFWECHGSGSIKPFASGTFSGVDNNDMWDLDGTDYMPQLASTHAAESFWDPDTSVSPSDAQPIDTSSICT